MNDNKCVALGLEDLPKDRPWRVKLGIDPTAPDLHLGHAVLLRALRHFQDRNHTAVLILGDFTAQIGDPSGRNAARVPLSAEQVQANSQTCFQQIPALLRPDRLEIWSNSTWLRDLDLADVIDLMATTTVGQMLAKEDFGGRYRNGNPIGLHEFLYPLLQGQDSAAIEADIELGGSDQRFNVAVGRDLQRHFGQPPQLGLLFPILPGTDGVQKMSKSLGNTVNLSDSPLDMYSKLEKVPDGVVADYLSLLTDLPPGSWPSDPRERQKAMALEVTASIHGRERAQQAQQDAGRLVASGQGEAVEVCTISAEVLPCAAFMILRIVGLCSSSSDARRAIQGGAVRLDGRKVTDPDQRLAAEELNGKVLSFGRKRFRRLVIQ